MWRQEHPEHKGLYAYKMYGKFDDVTALEFLEVQVSSSLQLWGCLYWATHTIFDHFTLFRNFLSFVSKPRKRWSRVLLCQPLGFESRRFISVMFVTENIKCSCPFVRKLHKCQSRLVCFQMDVSAFRLQWDKSTAQCYVIEEAKQRKEDKNVTQIYYWEVNW